MDDFTFLWFDLVFWMTFEVEQDFLLVVGKYWPLLSFLLTSIPLIIQRIVSDTYDLSLYISYFLRFNFCSRTKLHNKLVGVFFAKNDKSMLISLILSVINIIVYKNSASAVHYSIMVIMVEIFRHERSDGRSTQVRVGSGVYVYEIR